MHALKPALSTAPRCPVPCHYLVVLPEVAVERRQGPPSIQPPCMCLIMPSGLTPSPTDMLSLMPDCRPG